MKQAYTDSFLSDNEKAALQQFMASEVMYEAVKKVILTGVYYNGTLRPDQPADPARNFTLALSMAQDLSGNERLGEVLRAQTEGVRLVEVGFSALANYKPEELEKVAKENPAR